jgi:hypothetical protein
MTAPDSSGPKSRLTNELALRRVMVPSRLLNIANHVEALALSHPLVLPGPFFRFGASHGWPKLGEATRGPTACNLVELRGEALKNYEVIDREVQALLRR